MTDSHMELCGCECCNISKNFVPTLNKWVTNYVKWLKNEAQKPENREEKTRLLLKAKLVNDRFKKPDGTNKYDHPRDIVEVMTCPKVDVGDGRMIYRMECCLGRCKKCPSLYIPKCLFDKSAEARILWFEVYEKIGFCTEHKSIKKGPKECPECEEIKNTVYPEGQKKPDTGRYSTSKPLTKQGEKIGDFMDDFFLPQ